jgi:hypothetical protein
LVSVGYVAVCIMASAMLTIDLGDAPVRLAQVYMFLDVANEVTRMCGIPYAHKDRPFEDCECVPLPE